MDTLKLHQAAIDFTTGKVRDIDAFETYIVVVFGSTLVYGGSFSRAKRANRYVARLANLKDETFEEALEAIEAAVIEDRYTELCGASTAA